MHECDDTNIHLQTFTGGSRAAQGREVWTNGERLCCPDAGFGRRSGQEWKTRFITMFSSEFDELKIRFLVFLSPQNEKRQRLCRGTRCCRSSNIINNQYQTYQSQHPQLCFSSSVWRSSTWRSWCVKHNWTLLLPRHWSITVNTYTVSWWSW